MQIQSWERQVGEPEKAFRSFVIYRDLGASRSLRKVYDQLEVEASAGDQVSSNGQLPSVVVVDAGDNPAVGQPQKKRISGHVQDSSVRYRWVERARAWDNYVDRRLQARRLTDIEVLRKKQARAAAAFDAVNMVCVGAFLKRLNSEEGQLRLATIDFDDLMGLAIECSTRGRRIQDCERRANGIIEKPIDGQHGFYTWILSEFQPERAPEDMPDLAQEVIDMQPLIFPDEGVDPLDPNPPKKLA